MAGRQWAQADLRCMLCGRTVGRLVGPMGSGDGRATSTYPGQFQAFRPSDSRLPPVRLVGNERFRCDSCGGYAITEEMETFTTYDEVLDDEEEERRPRRGRPPKRFRVLTDDRLAQYGLAG